VFQYNDNVLMKKMKLIKDSVPYFSDLPIKTLMELALSLVPRHYMKHEIIANEHTATEGILFCYMGRIDLLLTSFSKGDYKQENIATE